jgi:arabinose-5-phosphate isomerase
MSKTPKTIPRNTLAMDALEIMNISKITSLVVSENDEICGVVHLHDILRNGLTT